MITVTVYKDMSKYQFMHFENAYNIGWHENTTPIDDRRVYYIDKDFLYKLQRHCEKPINIEHCGKNRIIIHEGKKCAIGFGEIRILDLDKGIRYAAPNIIYDDIIDKLYIPPKEFVEAVKKAPLPTDNIYIDFMSRYDEEHLFGENEDKIKEIEQATNAIENNDIQNYLDKNPHMINCVTSKGSLLHYSISHNKENQAQILIDKGIDINVFLGDELLQTLEMKMWNIANMLIENNIEMRIERIETNPLFLAIHLECVENIEPIILKRPDILKKTYNNAFFRNWTVDKAVKIKNNNDITNAYNSAINKLNIQMKTQKMLSVKNEIKNYKQGIPKFPKLEKVVPLPFHEKMNQFIVDYKELSEKKLWEKYELNQIWFDLNDYIVAIKKLGTLGKVIINVLVDFGFILQLDYKEDIADYDVENFWGDEPVKLVQFDIENDQEYYAYIPQSTQLESIFDVKIYDVEVAELEQGGLEMDE